MNDRIPYLIIKFLKDELSENDRITLEEWIKKSNRNEELFKELVNQEVLNKKLRQFNNTDKDVLWSKTLKKISLNETYDDISPIKRSTPWYRIAIAASLLITISIISYLSLTSNPETLIVEEQPPSEIVPGTNKATLTLSDGTLVSLGEKASNDIPDFENFKIKEILNDQVVYESKSSSYNTESSKNGIQYNQITTPRGGQYKVTLFDGTKVWLNAASSLRFPLELVNGTRRVELTGEAYFEVSNHVSLTGKRIPFIVKTSTQTVEVLGTRFNINAYKDEQSIKTTLVEGSVRVFIEEPNTGILLKPKQQSILRADQIHVVPADIESAIAWKEGYNLFNSEDLRSIMRQISRWYDVEIDFQGNMTNHRFGGKISRKEDITKVLEIISETGNVKFRIENSKNGKRKKIVVIPLDDLGRPNNNTITN